jgi:hypothetical protein
LEVESGKLRVENLRFKVENDGNLSFPVNGGLRGEDS